jgi:hypothetical protein
MFMYFDGTCGKYIHYIEIRSFVLLIRLIRRQVGKNQLINRMLKRYAYVRYQVLTAASMKMVVLWVVAL